MNDKVEVKALRPFEGQEGYKDTRSKPFSVSHARFAELRANGLVEEVGGARKAPATENKKAPTPSNKGVPGDGDRVSAIRATEKP